MKKQIIVDEMIKVKEAHKQDLETLVKERKTILAKYKQLLQTKK